MSVAAQSPPYHHKRSLDRCDSSPDRQAPYHTKRYRRLTSSPQRRATAPGDSSHAVTQSARAALMGLFPEASEQAVDEVLNSCAGDIDTAIKRLGELRLTANCRQDQPQASSSHANAAPAQASAGPPGESGGAASGQLQAGPSPQDVQQWADMLVGQLQTAPGLAEARHQAASVLHAYRSSLLQSSPQEVKRLEDVSRENTILKRAVTIQAQRLNEASAALAGVPALKAQVQEAQEKVHSLELANYSLAMHLRQANSSASGMHHSHDVF